MNNWKEQFKEVSFLKNQTRVVYYMDATRIHKLIVQQVLEQIEEAKLSELGNVIEELKQEYK